MALLNEEKVVGSAGIIKEFDENALSMMFNNVQKDQYRYPIKSFIREVASNGVDANAEKHVAHSILTGKSLESDHFTESDPNDKITKDSKFDRDYYDLKYLNMDNDSVEIYYIEQPNESRDKVIIRDHGVGLGGKRLQGYFKPGYSTKRLNKQMLGKFGIGSKSGLSTGVSSFQLKTRHNGKEYLFDIFDHTFESLVPKFDTETGQMNPYETWTVLKEDDNGEKSYIDIAIYYRVTTEKNMSEISIGVRNRAKNKQKYIEAVKEQLCYFDDVKLYVVDGYGNTSEKQVKADILYKEGCIILPDTNYYTKPHLVIDKVNYSYIDFGEFEMDEKLGNIAICVNSNEVDVIQSREAFKYNERNMKVIESKIDEATEIASGVIAKELKTDDFLEWISACRSTLSLNGDNQILKRLSGLIDRSNISPVFGSTGIKYGAKSFKKVFASLDVWRVTVSKNWSGEFEVNRQPCTTWGDFTPENVFLIDDPEAKITKTKCAYIWENHTNQRSFCVIRPCPPGDLEKWQQATPKMDFIEFRRRMFTILEQSKFCNKFTNELYEPTERFIDYYKGKKTDDDIIKEQKDKVEALPAAERRKLEEKTIYYEYIDDWNKRYILDKEIYYQADWAKNKDIQGGPLTAKKVEPKIKHVLENFTAENTIYGFGDEEDLLKFARMVIICSNNSEIPDDINIIRVSKSNRKYFRHCTHVNEFLIQTSLIGIGMHSELIKWNTGRKISEVLSRLSFLNNYKDFDDEIANTYKRVVKYYMEHFAGNDTLDWDNYKSHYKVKQSTLDDITGYLDKAAELQLFIAENPDDSQGISAMAKEYFSNPGIQIVQAVDIDIYEDLQTLLKYVEPYEHLFNHMDILTESGKEIPSESKEWIRRIITLVESESN